ncbi:cytochrome P450, putative [Phytophthora infestans T30-4]|uniref:Cytochrome P450, putative n=1 Tax=Phytophthora infestans (strain T30-4) TaxID=403677 RepID=D0NMZ5_PHYIT|nr:cytochrome P450, putative [Phytophthora infestans T30-4]EEY61902.1 cytochrome P450, putative [Phytophthora infestans T30-4]|eukprot:XP_002899542.1 cytochrome P450, putative [Phytophthora infestans T30-4]
MSNVDKNQLVLYAASCSLAIWVGSKILFSEPQRAARHRESLPLIGETWAAIKHAEHYYDWEAEMTEKMEGRPWMFNVVGRPTEFAIGKPEIIEDVLSTQFKSFGKGEYVREVLSDLIGDGVFAVDGHKWMQQRKTASNLFSTRELRGSMTTCALEKGETVDLFRLLNRFTFEVISEIAFGIKLGGLRLESEHPVETAFNNAQQRLCERFLEPTWLWKLQRWLNERELKENIQIIDSTCYDIISRSMKKRQVSGSAATGGKRNIISLFLDGVSDDAKSDQGLDPKYLRDIVVSFMTAGRDSTASALSWFFYTVSQHPEVEENIREEIFSKVPELANGTISAPSAAQAKELVYLDAAVKEVLRLYPAVPSNIREALEDVVLCDGAVVKAGETVSWSSYAMGRMPQVWGPDAKEFKPERWIDASTGKLAAVSPFKYPIFNAGPRSCLGSKLVMMEIKITAASVLSKYNLTVAPQQTVAYKIGLSLAMKNGLQVKVKKVAHASY